MAAEPGHGGVAEYYKPYYAGYNGGRNQVHATEEKSNRRLVGSLSKSSFFAYVVCCFPILLFKFKNLPSATLNIFSLVHFMTVH